MDIIECILPLLLILCFIAIAISISFIYRDYLFESKYENFEYNIKSFINGSSNETMRSPIKQPKVVLTASLGSHENNDKSCSQEGPLGETNMVEEHSSNYRTDNISECLKEYCKQYYRYKKKKHPKMDKLILWFSADYCMYCHRMIDPYEKNRENAELDNAYDGVKFRKIDVTKFRPVGVDRIPMILKITDDYVCKYNGGPDADRLKHFILSD